jgi:histidinol-phosphate aminotransferase
MSHQFGPDYIRAIAPYQSGKPISEVAREFGLDEDKIVKLASNENPLGMPASAKQAMLAAMGDLGRYPDANGFDLKAAIAAKYQVPQDWITLGNGSNDILELVAHALVEPQQAIMYAQYSFVVYPLVTQAVGARAIVVPAKDFGHDLDAMAAAIAADTKLVFVANPNNPTGTFIEGDKIAAFMKKVPAHVVVVLDEAYTEYLQPSQRYDALGWVRQYPNLIVSRTFSKAYGLAALRIGYGLMHAVELVADRASKKPADKAVPGKVQAAAYKAGAMVRVSGNNIILSPPLILSEADVTVILSAIDAGLATL